MEENREEKLSKFLLTLEYVLFIVGIALFFTLLLVATLVEMQLVFKILISVAAVLELLGVAYFCLYIEKEAGYYQCPHCGHKYVPTYKQIFCSMHMGRTRYMKCPKCETKNWQKKVLK